MSLSKINLLDFSDPKIRTLHLTWVAFFLTFMVWFNHAPLKPLMMAAFAMTDDQWKTLLTLNVALTIPARIVIGMLALAQLIRDPEGHTTEILPDGTVQLIEVS